MGGRIGGIETIRARDRRYNIHSIPVCCLIAFCWQSGVDLNVQVHKGSIGLVKSMLILVSALLVTGSTLSAQAASEVAAEQESIRGVIQTAYIDGIYNERDTEKIMSGIHDDFNMLVLDNNTLGKVTIQQWVEGIEQSKQAHPEPPTVPFTHECPLVQVVGNTAVAQVEVFSGDRHLYTDFMSLYKFADGWKIVAKIYYSHPG